MHLQKYIVSKKAADEHELFHLMKILFLISLSVIWVGEYFFGDACCFERRRLDSV